MRARTAFTLLELLIVIGIVLLLMGLVVVGLGHTTTKARATKCLSNLRQLQQAHFTYMIDHNGRFIQVGLPHGNLPNEEVAWINTLREYYQLDDAVVSPLDASPHWPASRDGENVPVPGTTDRFRQTSYGCNNYLTQYSPAPDQYGDLARLTDRLSEVKHPSSTIHFLVMVFTDQNGFCGADHVHVENWSGPDPAGQAAGHVQTNAVRGPERHWEGVSNYGFLDGHVETLTFAQTYLDTETNRYDPWVSQQWAVRTNGGQP